MVRAAPILLMILMTTAAHAAGTAGATTVKFDIEAHRGGRGLRPGNTLQSFANALSLGVDTLELDMGVTQDGVIVVSHSRGLNPDLALDADNHYVAEPGTPFVNLTLAQVQTWDVGRIRPGSAYAAQFPDQLAVPGTRIPTLAEVFDLVRRSGNQSVRLNIETKIDPSHPEESPTPERFVALVLQLLKREQFVRRVTIESFDWRTLQLVQQQAPEIPTVYLSQQQGPGATVSRDKPSKWTAGFDPLKYGGSVPRAIEAAKGAIWSPEYHDVDAATIAEAHRLQLKVVVWTVNRAEDMARLIDMGVDGIISDRPDILRSVVAAKGMAVPSPTPVAP